MAYLNITRHIPLTAAAISAAFSSSSNAIGSDMSRNGSNRWYGWK